MNSPYDASSKPASTEERLHQLNRFYGLITRINQAIIHIHKREELLREICAIVVEHGEFRMAWIGLLNEKAKQIEPIAHAGVEDGYLNDISIALSAEIPGGYDPRAEAFQRGKYFVSNDIAHDDANLEWRERALDREYNSSIALPLAVFGSIAGSFSIYSSVPFFFDSEEINLLVEVAANLGFALETIETQTRRQDAEAELRRSEAYFRQIAEHISKVLWLTNGAKNQLLYVSPAYETMWGRTVESLFSNPKSWLDAVHPYDRERLRRIIPAKQIAGNYDEEYRIYRPNGEIRWVRDRAFPIFSSDGSVERIVGIVADITDEKKALLRMETHLTISKILSEAKNLQHSLSGVLAAVCSNFTFEWAEIWAVNNESNALEPLVAWSLPTQQIEEFKKRFYNASVSKGEGLPGRVWKESRSILVPDIYKETFVDRADVTTVLGINSVFSTPIFSDSVVIGVLTVFFKDIHSLDEDAALMLTTLSNQIGQFIKRYRTEEALRESEERFRVIFSTEPECVKLVSPRGKLLEMNAAGLSMLEVETIEEAREYMQGNWLLPEYREQFLTLHEQVFRYGVTGSVEIEIIGVKGSRRWVKIHCAPLRNNKDEIIALLGVTHDISAHKQVENEIRQLNAELESRIEKRSADLHEAVRGKDELLHIISHDFRKALTNILISADIIKKKTEKSISALIDKNINDIKNTVISSVNILDNLTIIDSLETKQIPFVIEPVNISELLFQSIQYVSKKAAEKNTAITTDISDALSAQADSAKLNKAIENILSNAVIFSPHKSEIAIRAFLVKDGKVRIEIQDNGPGFTNDDLKKIFGKFALLSAKPIGGETSAGIGLFIAKQFIDGMGGSITCESQKGEGALFVIDLPALEK